MTSKQVVREIFNLSTKERIFDDFSCTYKSKVLHHGRIYLTENFICFYSSVLGIKHKLIIELKRITEIKKKNSLRILPNALKISTDDNNSYKFAGFSKRNTAYKSLISLWKNTSKYAVDIEDENEDENLTENEEEPHKFENLTSESITDLVGDEDNDPSEILAIDK